MAQWYKPGFRRGLQPATYWDRWLTEELNQPVMAGRSIRKHDQAIGDPIFVDARELGITMLKRYVKQYGRDSEMETLAIEQTFQFDIYDGRIKGAGPIAMYAGTFDGVTYDHEDGEIYLWEHKTAQKISTAFLDLDDQAGTYYAIATEVLKHQGILERGEYINGVLYNYLRKAKADPREQDKRGMYLNKDGSVSARQPAPFFHREVIDRNPDEVQRQFRRIRDEVLLMNDVRSGRVPVIKNTNWNCPYCPFFDMCKLDEKGNKRGVAQYRKLAYVETDPYADHRKSAADD